MSPPKFSGVLVPALTPFNADLAPDPGRFTRLCRYLLNQGADGLAVFGTTSEGNSISVDERNVLLDHLLKTASIRQRCCPAPAPAP